MKHIDDLTENAAVMYPLNETCKDQQVNFGNVITDILAKMPTYSLDLAELLSHNWKKVKLCQFVFNYIQKKIGLVWVNIFNYYIQKIKKTFESFGHAKPNAYI